MARRSARGGMVTGQIDTCIMTKELNIKGRRVRVLKLCMYGQTTERNSYETEVLRIVLITFLWGCT